MNGKILPIALAVSLTLNVFIVGAVAGAFGARARFERPRPPMAAMGPGGGGNPILRAADQLPPDVAQKYRERLRSEMEASRPMMQDARTARQAAADALAQPTFDKAATLAALAKARNAETAAREKLESAVVDFAAPLPADQRAELGKAIRRPPGPGRRGGGPGMGRGGGPFRGGPPPGAEP